MISLESLPEQIRKHVDPSAPKAVRMMAAKGRLPLRPAELLQVLYVLSSSNEKDVSRQARQTVTGLPSTIVSPLIDEEGTSPMLLDFIARNFITRKDYTQRLLVNRRTPDDTICWLAERVDDKYLDIIVQDQERQLRTPRLVGLLLSNPSLMVSSRARLLEFAKREGLSTGLGGAEGAAEPDLLDEAFDDFEGQTATQYELGLIDSEDDDWELPSHFRDEDDDDWELPSQFADDESDNYWGETEEFDPETDDVPLAQQMITWTVSQKIKAALLGNQTVRSMLIKDPNRLIALSVVKNPKLTEAEVVSIAANKAAHEDVIRHIAINREWLRNYQVKVHLVTNPKTPTPTALRFLPHLRMTELRSLVGNKNVPHVVAIQARSLYTKRQRR